MQHGMPKEACQFIVLYCHIRHRTDPKWVNIKEHDRMQAVVWLSSVAIDGFVYLWLQLFAKFTEL